MRIQLIANMKQKKEEVLSNNNVVEKNDSLENDQDEKCEQKKTGNNDQKVDKNSNTSKYAGLMTVEISGDNLERSVQLKEAAKEDIPFLKNGCEHVETELSGDLEKKVVDVRKGLSTSLFKLSAYMSQLQKETIGVESALRYVEELRSQLKETEDLVRLRENKVNNLRKAIKDQHEQIKEETVTMRKMEETCKAAGMTVPEEGAEHIQRKLAQIKNTAMKVKTTVYNEARESLDGEKEESGDVGPDLPIVKSTSPAKKVAKKILKSSKNTSKSDSSVKSLKTSTEPASDAIKPAKNDPTTTKTSQANNPSGTIGASVPTKIGETTSSESVVSLPDPNKTETLPEENNTVSNFSSPSINPQVGSADCSGSGSGSGSDYCSPLAHLHQNGVPGLDPHRPLCRFQLSGKCLDSGCPDQHTN